MSRFDPKCWFGYYFSNSILLYINIIMLYNINVKFSAINIKPFSYSLQKRKWSYQYIYIYKYNYVTQYYKCKITFPCKNRFGIEKYQQL